jgi:mannan polymerase II complex MNN10 subunit
MNLGLLTHYLPNPSEDYSELAAITIPQREEYCRRHGYTHFVHKGPYHNVSYYYAVQRLFLLNDLMVANPHIDVWWVLNVQALLTNLTKPVEDAVPDVHDRLLDEEDKHFWISHDCHGLNAGSFLVRNSEWGRTWIQLVADQTVNRNGPADPWHEQRTMMNLENHVFFRDRIQIVLQNTINSYLYKLYPPWNDSTPGNWASGDLVLSLPGLDLKRRLEIVRSEEWQRRIIT